MKRLRFFGLLVTVLLLAFGLIVGCSNGSTDEDTTEPVETTYTGKTASGQQVEILFSNKAIPAARARAAGEPNQGDNYQIKVDGREVSRGTIELLANGNIKFIPDDGPEFFGNLNNGILQVSGDNIGGSALSVNATVPGSSNVPGGVGGGGSGGGGGASGPGASGTPPTTPSVTPTAETAKIPFTINPPVITYAVTQTAAVSTASTTNNLILTFTVPAGMVLDGLDLRDVYISDDTGILDMSTARITETSGLVYTISSITAHKQGLVNLRVDKKNVDPVQKQVPVFVNSGAGTDAAVGATIVAQEFTTSSSSPTTTAAAGYFTTEAVRLSITVPADTVLYPSNLRWYSPAVNLGGNTLRAEVEPMGFYQSSNTVYFAYFDVIKQGELVVYLSGTDENTGKGFDPTPTTVYATKVEPIRYNVYRYSGPTGGASKQVTTTQLRFEFEYNPFTALNSFVWGTWLSSNLSSNPYGNTMERGNWDLTSAGQAAGNSERERIVTIDSAQEVAVTQGFVRFNNTTAGIETANKVLQVYRKPKSRYTVTSLETLGITTHLMIVFDPDTTDGSEFGNALAETDIEVKARNGQIIQGTGAAGNFTTVTAAGDYRTDPVATTNPAGANRYILKLLHPITPENVGAAEVTISGHADVEPISTVNLVHNGYTTAVAVTHADVTASATSVTLTFSFTPPLMEDTRYRDGGAAELGPGVPSSPAPPVFTAFNAGSTGVPAPTITAATGQALTSVGGGTGYTFAWTGSAGVFEDGNGTSFSNLSVTFGRPDTRNYTNFFIDPRAILFPFTFFNNTP